MTPRDTIPAPIGTMPAIAGHDRITYLDGWRALAVFIVILSHVTGFRGEPLWMKDVARWLPVGQIGALIFFFISGFVISRSALAEIDATGAFSVPAFYIRRGFRIIPPLALYLVVCLLLGAFGVVDFGPRNALPAFLYVCNVDIFNQCIWLGGHTWSLAYEEQFYLLFPTLLTLLLLRKAPFWPHMLFALAFCALPFFWPLSYAGRWDFYLVYGLFGAGFVAARHYVWLARLLPRFADAAFLLGLATVLAAPLFMPWPAIYNNYPLLFLLAIPLMLLGSGFGRLGGFLRNRALRYLGRISYGIYLWQELATSELTRHQPLVVEAAAVLGIVLLAALLFESMEKPLIRLGRTLAARWERPALDPAPAG